MSEKVLKLKDQIAIVTGGAKGMGRAISLVLAREGADVVVTAREHAPLRDLAKEIQAMGRRSIAISTDVTNWGEVQAMVKRTLDEFGKIDILVNVAGVTGPIETPTWEVKVDDWDYTYAVNVKGTFLCCKAVLPHMIKQRSGCIVNIVGTSGYMGYPNRSPYSSSKWAVRGFTKTLAMEVGDYGVRVNGIAPGAVEGGRMTTIVETKARKKGISYERVRKSYEGETALKRFIAPEEIAAGVLFLCTDATAVTGQVIRIDAGWMIGPFRREY